MVRGSYICFLLVACFPLVVGCSVDPLPPKACPCAEGYSCVMDVCVEGEADGGLDADIETPDVRVPDADTELPDGDVIETVEDAPLATPLCDRFPNALICEDFNAIDDWQPSTSAEDVALEVDSNMAHEGDSSLKVTIGTLAAEGFLTRPFTLTSDRVYTRVHIFIPEETITYITPHGIRKEDSGGTFVAVEQGRSRIFLSNEVQGNGEPVPKGEWVCMTTETINNASATLTMNRVTQVVRSSNTVNLEEYDVAVVGAENSKGQGPTAYWIDSFIVSETPVPCSLN